MKRDIEKLFRDAKLTHELKPDPNHPSSRMIATVHIDGEKLTMFIRKRRAFGSPSYYITVGHGTFYSSPIQIRENTTNGFGTDGGATNFAKWVHKTAIPEYKKAKEKKAAELDFKTKAAEVVNGDPRIQFIEDWDGSKLISFRVDDVLDGGKLADMYREYLNGTSLPKCWYVDEQTGKFVEDRDRYYMEQSKKQNSEHVA